MAHQIEIDVEALITELKQLLDSDPLLKFEAGLEEILNKNLSEAIRIDIRLAVASKIRELTIEYRFERMRTLKSQRISRHSVGKTLRRSESSISGKDYAAGQGVEDRMDDVA